MDYKTVLENQIKALEERQEALKNQRGKDYEACGIAKTIFELVELARTFK